MGNKQNKRHDKKAITSDTIRLKSFPRKRKAQRNYPELHI